MYEASGKQESSKYSTKEGLKSRVTTIDENVMESLINSIRKNGYGKRFNPRIYKTLGFELDEKKWIETISKLHQKYLAVQTASTE